MQPNEDRQLDDKELVGADPAEVAQRRAAMRTGSVEGDGKGDGKPQGQLRSVPGSAGEDHSGAERRPHALKLVEPKDSGGSFSGLRGFARQRRRWLIGTAVGGGVLALLFGTIFAFLAPLKLLFLKENIDKTTMSRLTHVLDRRSDRFIRTLIKAEIAGELPNGQNRYFIAKGWDLNSPVSQWYKDMRTDRFFEDLERNQGIRFVRETGGIGTRDRLVRLNVQGRNIDFSDLVKNGGLVANFDDLVDERFDSNRESRIAFNRAVKENTRFYQVVKRHHMRKWGYERLGITKWKFFEKTREKASMSVRSRWTKAVTARAQGGSFIKCVLNGAGCPETSNLNDSRNFTDPTTVDSRSQESIDEAEREIENGSDVQTRTNDTSKFSRLYAKKVVSKFLGVAGLADTVNTIFNIDKLFSQHKLEKLVAVARQAEYASSYMAFAVIVDQLKSGENVSSEEVNGVMEMFNGVEKSQAYNETIGNQLAFSASNVAYAAEGDNPEVAQITDNLKVSSDNSRASQITDFYNSTLGVVITPIRNIPGLELAAKAGSAVLSTALSPVMHLLSPVGSLFEKLSGPIEDLIVWLGGSPVCGGGENAGQKLNCIYGGGAATQESFLQYIGGGPLSDNEVDKIDKAIAYDEDANPRGLADRLFSLDSSDSLLAKLVMVTPTSLDQAASLTTKTLAAISPPNLVRLNLAGLFSQPAFAANGSKNTFGLQRFGPTENELDSELYGNKSSDACNQEMSAYKEAIEKGENPPTSMCTIDQDIADDLKCRYSDDDSCGGLNSGSGLAESDTSGAADGELPSGDAKELANKILKNPNIVLPPAAKADIQATASNGTTINKKLLQLLLGAAESGIKIQISVMKSGHSPGTLHGQGRAMDVAGIGGQIVGPSTRGDGGWAVPLNPEYKKFLVYMISHNKSGEFGVPNNTYLDISKETGATDTFVDVGSGPHFHVGVNQ